MGNSIGSTSEISPSPSGPKSTVNDGTPVTEKGEDKRGNQSVIDKLKNSVGYERKRTSDWDPLFNKTHDEVAAILTNADQLYGTYFATYVVSHLLRYRCLPICMDMNYHRIQCMKKIKCIKPDEHIFQLNCIFPNWQ
jgi:hypothetical protein